MWVNDELMYTKCKFIVLTFLYFCPLTALPFIYLLLLYFEVFVLNCYIFNLEWTHPDCLKYSDQLFWKQKLKDLWKSWFANFLGYAKERHNINFNVC